MSKLVSYIYATYKYIYNSTYWSHTFHSYKCRKVFIDLAYLKKVFVLLITWMKVFRF